ncbi:hypothetical protein [uncultured Tateyamaria sp.]|uniref:hypothetical protein n=1 Tax=uncultured Tateyamaria sp. TaxID=455651 RepID=UPI00262D9FE1|nr:hypothetical protein [uncultured Tateyamaria sp.]
MKKPVGIDERPEQLRPPVVKEVGVTESERYLANLADKTFLNLWSYPSPYRDQKVGGNGRGDGKELCDLLVVCGDHIIIFSEKSIDWPSGELSVAWGRWVKRAVSAAAKQAKGAERWITEHPDRIFLDRNCKHPFPIELPSPNVCKFHHVIVARGASDAFRKHREGHSGSLMIQPSLKGEMNWPKDPSKSEPFAIGDVSPEGSFVHVLDDVSLDIILQELDTIRDFTDYLEKKKEFVRSGRLKLAHGEENLLAYYAIRINDDGDHDFVVDASEPPLTIERDHYANWVSDPQYLAKKEADKISYVWDKFITLFTDHMLGGTSITIDDHTFELTKNELAVRHMALEMRFRRRSHGEAIMGALKRGITEDAFFRMMLAPEGAKDNETAFFIMTFKYLDWMEKKGGYEQYRRKRTERATIYAQGVLERYPHLKRIVGISREPPEQGRGVSEDLIYAEQSDWTAEDRRRIRENCKELGILQSPLKMRPVDDDEYPELTQVVFTRPDLAGMEVPNRKERRKQAARRRKSKRR